MTLKVIKTGKAKMGRSVNNPEYVYESMRFLEKKDREYFYVLHLDAKLRIIAKELISVGSLTSSSIHPREVFKASILNNSYAILCCHNHPSGDLNPSETDIEITQSLKKVGDLIGIPVIDHIIIGDNSYISIMEQSLENKPSQSENNKTESTTKLKEYDVEAVADLGFAVQNTNLMLKSIASLLRMANFEQRSDDDEDIGYGLSMIIETHLEKVDNVINEHQKRFLSHAELEITMTSQGAWSTAEKAREVLNENIIGLDQVISNSDIFKDRALKLKDKATTLLSSL